MIRLRFGLGFYARSDTRNQGAVGRVGSSSRILRLCEIAIDRGQVNFECRPKLHRQAIAPARKELASQSVLLDPTPTGEPGLRLAESDRS